MTEKSKAIVSVVGMDKPGIVATVSQVLADNQVNITDISQSYAREFFTMIMVVEFNKETIKLKALDQKLKKAGEEIGVFVSIQHEDIFRAMHRI
ncbi:MAG: ACT domain-containing protein [Promethearchaeia archaeon]